ncbi:MAG: CYTH and CHAD domain-containing protein [Proteobacteria bacterium]|nr:CYTH and CHAD domain-containing protein [Pseudomonadota bacterium]
MHEIELKFQIPAAQRRRVEAAVAGRQRAHRLHLQACYVDTPARLLARHGMALRLRREGRQWVQTLKGPAADGMTRVEHNVARGAGSTTPPVDPVLHAGVPLGARLIELLAAQAEAPLTVLYRTDIRRRTRLVRTRGGSVELAYDVGHILAGDDKLPVCELEIELKSGHAQVVLDTAARWVARYGLWLDARTKAERGDLLARGAAAAPPCAAVDVALQADMDLGQAWQQVLAACRTQIAANASQIATGHFGDEHVHQLRVGLRRLRSAWRLFGIDEAALPIAADAKALFSRLGEARDRSVLEAEFGAPLAAAWRRAGAGNAEDEQRPWLPAVPPGSGAPEDAVRDPSTQALLLVLLDPSAMPLDAAAASLSILGERIARWHRSSVRDARRFAELDDTARHRLRKRIKRLRYAVDFCRSLYPARAVRRYLKPVKALQERLGEITDLTMAIAAFRDAHARDARAAFALGWLTARHAQRVAEAGPDLRGYVKAPRFWKDG